MRYLLSFFFAILINGSAFGQVNPWSDIKESAIAADPQTRVIVPNHYRTQHLDLPRLKSLLAKAPQAADFVAGDPAIQIDFPLPYGGYSTFEVWEAPVMAPELTAKYPDIRSYAGRNKQGDYLRFSVSPMGLHALCLPVERANSFSIDQYSRGNVEDYICYAKKDCPIPADQMMESITEDMETEVGAQTAVGDRAGSCGNLRTYRLALACTGEYAIYKGATSSNKAPVIDFMNTCMTLVNAIFEIDAGVHMDMVYNVDLIYTDPATDPYTNNDYALLREENQSTCDDVIGTANYDIGHLFSTHGGESSKFGTVCGIEKAKAVTGRYTFALPLFSRVVTRCIGRQFNAAQTHYNNCGRFNIHAMEPGSGSTIMSLAYFNCPPKVTNDPDNYFHANSIGLITTFINGTGNSCAVLVPNGNSAPTCNAVVNKTIPKSTPFILTVTGASDPNGDALSYCWEQMDPFTFPEQPMPPASTNVSGAMFRSLPPSTSPSRYFPKFADVLNNTNDTWEVLPSVSRSLKFRVTIRDNHVLMQEPLLSSGCTTEKDVVLTVKSQAGPFLVTQPNTAVNWLGNSSQTVTWDVAGTKANGVNCSNVSILLTTDGGSTFTTLLASTPNDGSQTITVPNIGTTQARIMVQAVGNYFYDISNVNFTITVAQPLPFGSVSTHLDESLVVFPNPSTGLIQVHAPSKWHDKPLMLRIWDMEGRMVLEDPTFISGNTVEVDALVKGIYQLEVNLNEEKMVQIFVRQ